MKTIVEAFYTNEFEEKIYINLNELIELDKRGKRVSNQLYCAKCKKVTKLKYSSCTPIEKSYLSVFSGEEHDLECGIEKKYTTTEVVDEVIQKKPEAIFNELRKCFADRKISTIQKESVNDVSNDETSQNSIEISEVKKKKYLILRTKKLNNITDGFLKENEGKYIKFYGLMNIYKITKNDNTGMIKLQCVANDTFFNINITGKVGQYLNINDLALHKKREYAFFVKMNQNEWKGKIYNNFYLQHSMCFYEVPNR